MQHASKYQISENWLILEHFWEHFNYCTALWKVSWAVGAGDHTTCSGLSWWFWLMFPSSLLMRLKTQTCYPQMQRGSRPNESIWHVFFVLCELPFEKGLEWLVCKTSSLCNSIWPFSRFVLITCSPNLSFIDLCRRGAAMPTRRLLRIHQIFPEDQKDIELNPFEVLYGNYSLAFSGSWQIVGSNRWKSLIFQGNYWVCPPPSNGDHQDSYIFSMGSLFTVTFHWYPGWGILHKHTSWFTTNWWSVHCYGRLP